MAPPLQDERSANHHELHRGVHFPGGRLWLVVGDSSRRRETERAAQGDRAERLVVWTVSVVTHTSFYS